MAVFTSNQATAQIRFDKDRDSQVVELRGTSLGKQIKEVLNTSASTELTIAKCVFDRKSKTILVAAVDTRGRNFEVAIPLGDERPDREIKIGGIATAKFESFMDKLDVRSARVGMLEVISEPDGAIVFFNGKRWDTTRAVGGCDEGEHVIRIESPGYKTHEEKVRVTFGHCNTIERKLIKE